MQPQIIVVNHNLEMVREYEKLSGKKADPDTYSKLIREECGELLAELVDGSNENLLKEMADVLYVLYGYANSKGWSLDEAVRRVHQNNIGRMIQPDGRIIRNKDGKIMKNKEYKKAYLGDLV